MKISMLSRNPSDYIRETKKDVHKVSRNYASYLHPFEEEREYADALNATKLERVFAKPFIGTLDGHRDGIHVMASHPTSLSLMLSGSTDGEIRLWNVTERRCLFSSQAHENFVRGLCWNHEGDIAISCGNDKVIKSWRFNAGQMEDEPVNTIICKQVLYGASHHIREAKFATCGEDVSVWAYERALPVRTFNWGHDSIISIQYNPLETDIIGCTAMDKTIILYDSRAANPMHKVLLTHRSNDISWNPLNAFSFTVANDDYNLYTFDARSLSKAVTVHRNHVGSVMSVDYSPTGQEFVSGGYDKSVRIFSANEAHSRDVYHTKRMQQVHCVRFSRDARYVFSGSDEMNIRLWKAKASEKLGRLAPREVLALQYSEKIKTKFSHYPEISRIQRHRHLPKHIFNHKKELEEIRKSVRRKSANRRAHSKPGSVPFRDEKKAAIIKTME